jgi:hypothetical protein
MRAGQPIRGGQFTFTPAEHDGVGEKRPPSGGPAVVERVGATPLDIDGSR